ncbi:MAG TPA: hypothetical protein VFE14_04635 [Micromonosporaceae bacterium]|nr:hypothetical protein [Micromonosporaceae bacterium]
MQPAIVIEELRMINMPYATAFAAAMVAAAVGATAAAWALSGGSFAESHTLVAGVQRWQSRVSNLSKPVLSMVDAQLARAFQEFTLRMNALRVRVALLRTRRLLRKSRRMHVGMHRIAPSATSVQRRFAGMPAGWLRFPVVASRPAQPAVVDVTVHNATPAPAAVVAEVRTAPVAAKNTFVETSPDSYRHIRTHRRTRGRAPALRPAPAPRPATAARPTTKPSIPRQRAARSRRAPEAAVA